MTGVLQTISSASFDYCERAINQYSGGQKEGVMPKPKISLVVAMTPDPQCVIGKSGELPWRRIPSDMNRFRRITLEAKNVFMGRATFESLPKGTLENRRNLVLTTFPAAVQRRGGEPVASIDEAIRAVGDGELCVIGGARLYAAMIPYCEFMHITTVHADIAGDTRFPEVDWTEWQTIYTLKRMAWGLHDPHETSYVIYRRRATALVTPPDEKLRADSAAAEIH